MSEIKRYKMEFAPGSGGWIKQTARGELVLFTDHEAAIEQVLADVKARIEGALVDLTDRHDDDPYLKGYRIARRDALAALTQPQTERCPEDCDGFGRLIGDSDGPCPACSGLESDGGGAATAAGVADADLEGIEVHINGSSDLSPEEAEILGDAMKRAYVLMKERQGTTAIKPTPYAKAFRERVCPVPEFPSIRETAHEAIIEGGCCIQCGLPNNSETVLFHSCQAGAPADPTCPNTGHKFSHCDCDLGIEKEES